MVMKSFAKEGLNNRKTITQNIWSTTEFVKIILNCQFYRYQQENASNFRGTKSADLNTTNSNYWFTLLDFI